MNNVLLAGATGYLGGYVARELADRGFRVRAVVRNPGKLARMGLAPDETATAEVTRPETLEGCCRGIDAVISTVGITRQKDGLTYMDVDYRANLNLLRQAQASGVKKFIYVSVLNGERFQRLKGCRAKERFVRALKESGLEYCVIRPNGFFSDMADFLTMAKKGRVYLFGRGDYRINPIHGEDLARVCVDAIQGAEKDVDAGGPEILTHREIAETAFAALGLPVKITSIPNWIRASILALLRVFTGSRFHGPIEFFMTVMATDMIAPKYGKHTLKEFFASLAAGKETSA